MLMYGDSSNIINTGQIFNITSLINGYNRLDLLYPPYGFIRSDNRDFDMSYYNYIMNNDNVFVQFFNIVYNLYLGNDVYLIISMDNWSINIIEAILKIIQQRYGYDGVLINDYSDYLYFSNSKTFGFDNGFGLMNLDKDLDRYIYLIESSKYGIANYNYH